MFEKFTSNNFETFQQRYEGTYGFYHTKDKHLLTLVRRVEPRKVTFIDSRGVEYYLNADAQEDVGFVFLPPESRWYNTKEGTYYVQRRAARQFQRGIGDNNTSVFLVSERMPQPKLGLLAGGVNFGIMNVEFTVLTSIFEKAITPIAAYANFDRKKGMALSGQFGIAGDQVCLYKENIGTYALDKPNNRFSFKLYEPDLWRVELSDVVKAIGCTSEISRHE